MTLDELIEIAWELRDETGGDAPVLLLTDRGYTSLQISDGLGFEHADGSCPCPLILVVPSSLA